MRAPVISSSSRSSILALLVLSGLALACSGSPDDPGEGAATGSDGGSGDGGGSGSGADGGSDEGSGESGSGGDDTGSGAGGEELSALDTPLLGITGPGWGYDHPTTEDSVVLVGVAREDVVGLVVSSGDEELEITAASTWSSPEVPLAEGDNTLTVTAWTEDGTWQEAALVVTRNDSGVSLSSGLQLSTEALILDGEGSLWAAVRVDGEVDGVEVGVDDGAGGLSDVLGVLEEVEEGLWSGELLVDTSAEQTLSLRALATAGGETGSTPAVEVAVAPLPELDEVEAAAEVALDGWEEVAELEEAEARAAALEDLAQALEAETGVDRVIVSPSLDGVEVVTASGFVFNLLMPVPGTRGGLPVTGGPAIPPPSQHMTRTTGAQGWSPAPSDFTTTEVVSFAALSPFFSEWSTQDRSIETHNKAQSSECPAFEELAFYADAERHEDAGTPLADVAAFRDALEYSLIHITGHAGRRYAAYIPGRPAVLRPGGEAIIGTAERYEDPNALLDAHGQAILDDRIRMTLSRNPDTGVKSWVPGITGDWIRAERAGAPMPQSIVMLNACNTGTWLEPMRSFEASGSAFVVGVAGSFHASSGVYLDDYFWPQILEQATTETAFAAAYSRWTAESGETVYPVYEGSFTHVLDTSPIRNGGFEEGTVHWSADYPEESRDFDFSVTAGANGAIPQSGSYMAEIRSTLDPDSKTYNEFHQQICPVETVEYELSFSWQVATEERSACSSSGVPNTVIVRIDGTDVNEVLGIWYWADVCPLLQGSGAWRTTGWQEETIRFTAPDLASGSGRVTFAVNGYNDKDWNGYFDNVALFSVD